eukprot:2851545-Prymnesium_polylepis.2
MVLLDGGSSDDAAEPAIHEVTDGVTRVGVEVEEERRLQEEVIRAAVRAFEHPVDGLKVDWVEDTVAVARGQCVAVEFEACKGWAQVAHHLVAAPGEVRPRSGDLAGELRTGYTWAGKGQEEVGGA